jgi:hypothetical protein
VEIGVASEEYGVVVLDGLPAVLDAVPIADGPGVFVFSKKEAEGRR